jgi:predicted esterase
MSFPSFDDLHNRIQNLYQEKDYEAALKLSTEEFEKWSDQRPLLYYFRIVLSALVGKPAQALKLLQKALDEGLWYNDALLRKSPSLAGFQGQADFEKLAKKNQLVYDQDRRQEYPMLIVHSKGECLAGSKPCPLLLALHGNTSDARKTLAFWRSAATAGWLVAAPRSSQAMWKGAYVWDDRELAEKEIRKHFKILQDQYEIDSDRIILAGHSMGGEIAMWLALTRAIPAIGFIANGPGGPFMDNLEEWEPLARENAGSGLHGYIITGSEDRSIPQENVRRLVELFNANDIPCRQEEIPGASHDFMPAYSEALLHGIEFISG